MRPSGQQVVFESFIGCWIDFDLLKNLGKSLVQYHCRQYREQGDHIKPLRTSRVSKDSGAWEENATVVLNVWRPMGFDPGVDKYIHLFLGKNRGPGVSAEHVMWWDGKEGSFRKLTDDEYEHYRRLWSYVS